MWRGFWFSISWASIKDFATVLADAAWAEFAYKILPVPIEEALDDPRFWELLNKVCTPRPSLQPVVA